MRLSPRFHIGAILSIIVFCVSYFIMERVSLRAQQLSQNTLDVEPEPRQLLYAITCTVVFILFYYLVSKEFVKKD